MLYTLVEQMRQLPLVMKHFKNLFFNFNFQIKRLRHRNEKVLRFNSNNFHLSLFPPPFYTYFDLHFKAANTISTLLPHTRRPSQKDSDFVCGSCDTPLSHHTTHCVAWCDNGVPQLPQTK